MARILDLYCCAGGASKGYELAGHTIVAGVDIKLQRHYQYTFIQRDVIKLLQCWDNFDLRHKIDFIHASPPCQRFSTTSKFWDYDHPNLIDTTRQLLDQIGLPYAIENVVGAPLINPVMLCGTMFGLDVIRHRNFECKGFNVKTPPACNHAKPVAELGRWPDEATQYHCVVGHFSNVAYAKRAMGINWMVRDELSQAIPPAYTKWLGEQIA